MKTYSQIFYFLFLCSLSNSVWASCGDGTCDSGEDCNNCVLDCGSCCGDGTCSTTENCGSCQLDCGSCNTACPSTEEYPALCNNTTECDGSKGCTEDNICPPITSAICGNLICEGTFGEDADNCSSDCGISVDSTCGNQLCENELGEDCKTCAQDCKACPINPVCNSTTKVGFKLPLLKNAGPSLKTPDYFPIKLEAQSFYNFNSKDVIDDLNKKKLNASGTLVGSLNLCVGQRPILGGVPVDYCLSGSGTGIGGCATSLKCAELAPVYQPDFTSLCCQSNFLAQLSASVKLVPLNYPSKQSLVRCELEGSAGIGAYLGGQTFQIGFGCPSKLAFPNSAGIKMRGNLEGSCFASYAGQKYGVGAEGVIAGCVGTPENKPGVPGPFGYSYEYGIPPIKIAWFRISDWRYSSSWGVTCIP